MALRAVSRDEEGKKKIENKLMPKTRHPETARYFERKLEDKGLHRLERHPADGLGGIRKPLPKSGHGGKFTWEGPEDDVENEMDPVPPAIDPRDPNYPGDEETPEQEEVEELIVGEVEVAKAAEAKEGVSRIDVVAPHDLVSSDVKSD